MSIPQSPELPPLDWAKASPSQLLSRIQDAGIVGMGGAGFATATKLSITQKNESCTLIVNGVESDPGVTADQTLIRNHTHEVIMGARVVQKILNTKHTYFAVSDAATSQAIENLLVENESVHVIKWSFQSGEERVLIRTLTDQSIGADEYPATSGIAVLNVHTLYAIWESINGKLLAQRIITVLGEDKWVPLGSPLQDLVDPRDSVRIGCYETSTALQENATLLPTHNAISVDRSVNAVACIRCGWCTTACPKELPVEYLYLESIRQSDEEELGSEISPCNDCGACVAVCPSHIHVLEHLRELRQRIQKTQEQKQKALAAKARFEARQQRLEQTQKTDRFSRSKRMSQPHDWS